MTIILSVSGFNKPFEMIIEWARGMIGGFTYVEYPYIWLYQKALFGEKLDAAAVDSLNSVDTPVLIIHGSEDNTVGYHESGIINYRDEITNPNVKFKICDKEHQNGHSNLFISLSAIECVKEAGAEYDRLYEEYDGNIPEEKEKEFFSSVDKKKCSELDEDFMNDVLSFYESVL
ncbi:MAG: hypothetical protein NC394_02740 [Bacteroides sp.]|nr:hypothetical protein [Bacteroides sp.]